MKETIHSMNRVIVWIEYKELLKMQKYEWILGVYVKNARMKKSIWVYDKNKRLREIKTFIVKCLCEQSEEVQV